MRADRISIQRNGHTETTDSCPFWEPGPSHCTIDVSIPCRYGLTEIKVPEKCPLLKGGISTFVFLAPLRFSPENDKPTSPQPEATAADGREGRKP